MCHAPCPPIECPAKRTREGSTPGRRGRRAFGIARGRPSRAERAVRYPVYSQLCAPFRVGARTHAFRTPKTYGISGSSSFLLVRFLLLLRLGLYLYESACIEASTPVPCRLRSTPAFPSSSSQASQTWGVVVDADLLLGGRRGAIAAVRATLPSWSTNANTKLCLVVRQRSRSGRTALRCPGPTRTVRERSSGQLEALTPCSLR
mmetsp:Transcript_21031/g.51462  ORF Transcript_21031/g.51462 Transcript_21031/m.51462 type:complete len:204 (-) Transcript_21031:194-805(-)